MLRLSTSLCWSSGDCSGYVDQVIRVTRNTYCVYLSKLCWFPESLWWFLESLIKVWKWYYWMGSWLRLCCNQCDNATHSQQMYVRVENQVLMCLALLSIVVKRTVSQFANYNDYGDTKNDNNLYGNYDYGYEEPPEEIMCYTCTYHVRKGAAAGLEGCRDPFISEGIPEVPCRGDCAKIYHKISDNEYSVSRVCLPGCRSVMDSKGYTECCEGSLCNSTAAGALSLNISVLICSLFLYTWLLWP